MIHVDSHSTSNPALVTTIFDVSGMGCRSCIAHIQQAFAGQPGLEGLTVDLPAGKVRVAFHRTVITEARIVEVLAEAGYPATPASIG